MEVLDTSMRSYMLHEMKPYFSIHSKKEKSNEGKRADIIPNPSGFLNYPWGGALILKNHISLF